MKKLIFFLFLMYGCNTTKTTTMDCNKNEAQKTTDNLMLQKGYNLTSLNKTIEESLDYFTIKYMPKDTMSLGGGAVIKISKKDCKIVDGKFYQ